MNILFYNSAPFNPTCGGIERITDTLAKGLLKRGHNVFYLSRPLEAIMDYDFPVKMHTFPAAVACDPTKREAFYGEFLTTHNIDVVVNQVGIYDFQNVALTIPDGVNVKRISVLHNAPAPLIFIDRKHTTIKALKYCVKIALRPLYKYYLTRKEHLRYRRHYGFVFDHSDIVCLLSKRFYGELRSIYDYPKQGYESKLTAIGNANSYKAQSIDYSAKRKQILYVGRLISGQKRVVLLLKIWRRLYRANPDWELIIVGCGEEEQHLKKYVATHAIEHVKFEGRQNPKPYLEKASIFCLTSSIEGFPMVLGEAMVHGCVPFSFNSYRTIYDIVDDGENGVIVPWRNLKEYAHRLNTVMNDDALRVGMGKAAQQKIETFAEENILNQWEELLADVTAI